jgi:serine/threonine protein kinase
VFKVISKADLNAVILKKVSFSAITPKEKEYIVNEVNTLLQMNYVHILRYLDYEINKKDMTVDIVMENCEGGSLQDLLNKAKS